MTPLDVHLNTILLTVSVMMRQPSVLCYVCNVIDASQVGRVFNVHYQPPSSLSVFDNNILVDITSCRAKYISTILWLPFQHASYQICTILYLVTNTSAGLDLSP